MKNPDTEVRSSRRVHTVALSGFDTRWLVSQLEWTLGALYILGPELVQLMLENCNIKVEYFCP